MPKKDDCAVSGSETDVRSHCLWTCLWRFRLASILLLGKHVDVACLVSYKGVIWHQWKPLCALGAILIVSSATSKVLLNCVGLPDGAKRGLLFLRPCPSHLLAFPCLCSMIYCCGKSWEKLAPELMVINSGHPAPQVSCRSLASRLTSRNVSLITLITVAQDCQGHLSVVVPGFAVQAQPCQFSRSDLNDTQRLQAVRWDGEGEKKYGPCIAEPCYRNAKIWHLCNDAPLVSNSFLGKEERN